MPEDAVSCSAPKANTPGVWAVNASNGETLEGYYFAPDEDYPVPGKCAPCAGLAGTGKVCGGVVGSSPNFQLVDCPGGQTCPSASTARECPSGYYCRKGFTDPMACSWSQSCPAGADERAPGAGAGIMAAVILLLTLAMWLVFTRIKNKTNQRATLRVELSAEAESGDRAGAAGGAAAVGAAGAAEGGDASIAIDFHGLSMTLKSTGQPVLEGVSGSFPAGALAAVMGPSGGGKTTFMNALCGRADYGHVTGDIFINGHPGGVGDFPSLVGFVPQDDILFSDLTVFEALYFNALLRLPLAMRHKAKVAVVRQVLDTLEVGHIQHAVIGDEARRGISGGQKKRVSIGLELTAAPRVLFMDEPTSGLDGAAALQLARCIRKLGAAGITVVCVIHQPRFAVFNAFTHLLLLGKGGRTVYCGETGNMRPYLEGIGFRYSEGENVADWMIDVVSGESARYDGDRVDDTFAVPEGLFARWAGRAATGQPELSGEGGKPADRVTPGFRQQFVIMFRRCGVQFRLAKLMGMMAMFAFLGVMGGLLGGLEAITQFFGKNIGAAHNASGALFVMVSAFPGYTLLAPEQLPFRRERSAGVSMPAYFLAKQCFNILDIVIPTLVYVVCAWLLSFPDLPFGDMLLIYVGLSVYCTGIGVLIGALFSGNVGLLLTVIAPAELFNFFSGILIPLRDFPAPLFWLAHLGPGLWFMEAVTVCTFREWPAAMQADPAVRKLNLDDTGFAGRFDAGWGAPAYFGIFCLLGCAFRLEAAVLMHHLPKVPQYRSQVQRAWARVTGSAHRFHASKEEEVEHKRSVDAIASVAV
uniref:ABC transporter domain-containing protein n=1 Tax=Zooxanthella nutricula TaxID=1333877 RepID=A0A6U8X0Z0_9DINO